jgi:hypothetical protein
MMALSSADDEPAPGGAAAEPVLSKLGTTGASDLFAAPGGTYIHRLCETIRAIRERGALLGEGRN